MEVCTVVFRPACPPLYSERASGAVRILIKGETPERLMWIQYT